MKRSLLLLAIFITLLIYCSSCNTPCPYTSIEWMEISEDEHNIDGTKVALSLSAAAKADADSIQKIIKADAGIAMSTAFNKEYQNITKSKRKVKVTQDFYQKMTSITYSMCNLWSLLQDDKIDSANTTAIVKQLQDLSGKLSNIAFDSKHSNTDTPREVKQSSLLTNSKWRVLSIKGQLSKDPGLTIDSVKFNVSMGSKPTTYITLYCGSEVKCDTIPRIAVLEWSFTDDGKFKVQDNSRDYSKIDFQYGGIWQGNWEFGKQNSSYVLLTAGEDEVIFKFSELNDNFIKLKAEDSAEIGIPGVRVDEILLVPKL